MKKLKPCKPAALTLMAMVGSLISCTTPKPAITGDKGTQMEEFEVKGRQGLLVNQRLSFGEYTTLKVDRSWTKTSSWSIGASQTDLTVPGPVNVISYDHINRKQTLRFAAQSSMGEVADVYAANRVKARELRIGEGNGPAAFTLDLSGLSGSRGNNLFYVQIYIAGSDQPWQLILDNEMAQEKAEKYSGYLYGPNNRYYQLRPLRHYQTKQGKKAKLIMGHIGFEILDEEGVSQAAVSTLDKGLVYLNNSASPKERFLLENLCAALLLQEHI